MEENIFKKTHYLTSATKLSQLPEDTGIEIAFAGRSNAGKSSAINTITNTKNLARTSKTPGRTQMINLFALDDSRRLVDLPGYGYAKVPKTMKEEWQKFLGSYLEQRECLRGLILLMDIRHPLKEYDENMVAWCADAHLPVHILLTKADKLKKGAQSKILNQVKQAVKNLTPLGSVQSFSSVNKMGLDRVKEVLSQWYEL